MHPYRNLVCSENSPVWATALLVDNNYIVLWIKFATAQGNTRLTSYLQYQCMHFSSRSTWRYANLLKCQITDIKSQLADETTNILRQQTQTLVDFHKICVNTCCWRSQEGPSQVIPSADLTTSVWLDSSASRLHFQQADQLVSGTSELTSHLNIPLSASEWFSQVLKSRPISLPHSSPQSDTTHSSHNKTDNSNNKLRGYSI